MNRTAFTIALGLIGGLLATSANAQSYSTSTLNRDGSRTLCGPNGCTTVPASSISYRPGTVGRYVDDYRYANYGYGNSRNRNTWDCLPSSTRPSTSVYDSYYDRSRHYGSTLPRSRSAYDTYRDHWDYHYDRRYDSRYDSRYDRLNPVSRHYNSSSWYR